MVLIDKYTGRFGNRILQYYNLIQLSTFLNVEFSSVKWEGSEYFKNTGGYKKSNRKKIIFNIDMKDDYLLDISKEYDIVMKNIMGDLFYRYKHLSTFDVFKLNVNSSLDFDGKKVAIHFRGTDFRVWSNGKGILSLDYYINSIELLSKIENNIKFYLFTDDKNMNNYKDVIKYLSNNKMNFSLSNDNYIQDFANISNCDYVISTPSTFAICASFMGKKNKKIVHSTKWLEYSKDDIFWDKLLNGGNEDYKLWKKI
jgi:hypothetical protein